MIDRQDSAVTLGRRIRALRLKKKLTQEQLAAEVGLSRVALNRIENGIGLPQVDTLFSIADVLDVPTDRLRELSSAVEA